MEPFDFAKTIAPLNNTEKFLLDFFTERGVCRGQMSTTNLKFDDAYIHMCISNHCGQYKKKWSCALDESGIHQLRDRLLDFKRVMLFSYISKLTDQFDIEGMDTARKAMMDIAYTLKREINKKRMEAIVLGAGSCEICEKCTYPSQPCQYPSLMLYPIESLGIDVLSLTENCGLNYYNGENTVTYFCAIFY